MLRGDTIPSATDDDDNDEDKDPKPDSCASPPLPFDIGIGIGIGIDTEALPPSRWTGASGGLGMDRETAGCTEA